MVRCSSSSHYLAPAGGGGSANCKGECWCCLLSLHCGSYWSSQVHTGLHAVALLLILAGESDVHFKLSIIPNCMLPVMIV